MFSLMYVINQKLSKSCNIIHICRTESVSWDICIGNEAECGLPPDHAGAVGAWARGRYASDNTETQLT